MKLKKIVVAAVLIGVFTIQSFALEVPGYEGGIKNELAYKEVIFVTGEPILMEGTVDIKVTQRNNTATERYSYRLSNLEKEASLSRSVTITKEVEENKDQKIENIRLSSYKESITVGGDKYLVDQKSHQWSKSDIYHKKPGVTYYAGNLTGRKTYTVNRTEGKVTIETEGTSVGYDQNWGSTKSQMLNHYIKYEGLGDVPIHWQGTYEVEAVHNRTKDYAYMKNIPSQISFNGGYILTQQEENVLKYSFDMPRFNEDKTIKLQRNTGSKSLNLKTSPTNERLNIPNMQDVLGHWAEKDILFLSSLKALYPDSTNIGPATSINRGDFARAVAVIMGVEKKEQAPPRRGAAPKEEDPSFVDVGKELNNQKYIEAVYEKGIMEGVGKNIFAPNQFLTKAEAITVLVRALGFENLAPLYNYSAGFKDDKEIPTWAKGAVYVGKDLGLIQGANGYFQPNKEVTKAEAATMLVNFISYLQKDLRYDYRESILNR